MDELLPRLRPKAVRSLFYIVYFILIGYNVVSLFGA